MSFLYQRYETFLNVYPRQCACSILRNGEVTAWMLALVICSVRENIAFLLPALQVLSLGLYQIVIGETFGNEASTNWSTTHVLNILL